jgi:hypothetical protein
MEESSVLALLEAVLNFILWNKHRANLVCVPFESSRVVSGTQDRVLSHIVVGIPVETYT